MGAQMVTSETALNSALSHSEMATGR